MPQIIDFTTHEDYRHLLDTNDTRTRAWIEAQNATFTREYLDSPLFERLESRILDILNSKDKLHYPYIYSANGNIYHFLQDDKHIFGIFRRTTLTEYQLEEPVWEEVFNLDNMSDEDKWISLLESKKDPISQKKSWSFKGFSISPSQQRALVTLSYGGGDACVVREFDILTNQFVIDSPFEAREAKNKISWCNDDALWIGSDFGDGSLTESGYPRLSKLWQRGERLETAKIAFSGELQDISAICMTIRDTYTEETHDFSFQVKTFYNKKTFFIKNLEDSTILELPIPKTADLEGIFDRQLILKLNDDWAVSDQLYPAGSVVSVDFFALIREDNLQVSSIFCPDSENKSVYSALTLTKNHLLLTTLKDVCCEMWRYYRVDNVWYSTKVDFHEHGVIAVTAVRKHTDECFVTFHNMTTPVTLYHYDVSTELFTRLKQAPKKFEHENFITEQYFATHIENDQEIRIPYFVARHKDMAFDGSNFTWLYGYGGFKATQYPSYVGGIKGKFWLEQGGVYVIAGIRGGGEYGPKWHQAVKRENRPKAFRDFIAVAEDLIARGISSPKCLGISGGSNGGLLVNAVVNMRPDLFSAVHSSVGLLDMLAFHKLLAGASWKDEYGNPDVQEDAEYLATYSPPHNYCEDKKYPQILFTTSQTDDRVHPYHSRVSAKRLQDLGKKPLYFEIIDGGHGYGISNKQSAFSIALEYVFFLRTLCPTYSNTTAMDTAFITPKASALSLFRPMEEASLPVDNSQQITQNTSNVSTKNLG